MKTNDKLHNEKNLDASSCQKEQFKINKNVVSNTIYEWSSSIIIAFVIVIVLLSFVFRLIDVDGTSMESTLIDTDKVVVTDLFYQPHDSDIVVISHGEVYDKPLVKRVIATEGQTLKIDFDKNEIYVDGELLEEDYIQGATVKGNAEIPSVIPEGKVFVLGDNRTVSLDSRYKEVGLIDTDSIIGKAQFVVIPHVLSEGGNPKLDFSQMRYLY